MNEEEELFEEVRRAPDGDLRAFESLVRRHQRRIVADCRHITKDQSIAEDLAQEVFVKAYFGLANFEGRASFRRWLQVIKVHHCLNHLKKQKGKAISIEDEILRGGADVKAFATIDKDFDRINDQEVIHRVLDAMPENLRLPLVLRDMDELSYEEVATNLKIGLSAAKMRIKRAREWFRTRYQMEMSNVIGQRAYE
jgi:RNA polymerase sigma-70 factor (ECF subfamily)